MLRGEFIRADGLVIPNNITTYGIAKILGWGLAAQSYSLFMGLANCNPSTTLDASDLAEPTIGVEGYARQEIAQGAGWPTTGVLNDETYFETAQFTFTATGVGFNKAISRLALITSETDIVGGIVVSLSGALPAEYVITPATDLASRQFKYRIYGR